MERQFIAEMLELYKDSECLWNPRHVTYTDRQLKDEAYSKMLEMYRKVQSDATLKDLKKRLENMRTSYNRERKKVIQSRLENAVHIPVLWYFKHLSFLDDLYHDSTYSTPSRVKSEDDDDNSVQRVSLKRRYSTLYIPEKKETMTSSIAEDDDDDGDIDFLEDHTAYLDTAMETSLQPDEDKSIQIGSVTALQSFGTTIGLQLKDLDPLQQVIAEKLISEVIFNARLQKLTPESRILLNDNVLMCNTN